MKVIYLLLPLLGLVASQTKKARQKDCTVSTFGSDFTGTQPKTVSGRTCQRWDSTEPHSHSWTDGYRFPDGDMDSVANNCRNVDIFDDGPWCFTEDPGQRWEHCDIPQCHDMPECRRTEEGTEYRGSQDTSASGKACLAWDAVRDAVRDAVGDAAFPRLEGLSYCRNPDGKEGGPWCFVGEDGEWEYCDVPYCKPSASCVTPDEEYVGTVAVTEQGRFCQRWDVQWPHKHNYTDDSLFPDGSVEDAENYCRNPEQSRERPWCFTTNPDIEWQYCDLPQCPDCVTSERGQDYAGTKTQTASGVDCQRWDQSAFTDPNRFPDASVGAAGSMCRNPDHRAGGPWCFTDILTGEWESCAIPMCQASCDDHTSNTPRPALARHVIHIGVDGLDPCFVDAPGGTPNILQRLRALGTSTLDGGRNLMPVWSAPNWAGHMAAMTVPSSGVKGNGWRPTWRGYAQQITPVTGKDVPFPSVAGHLRGMDDSVRTAAFYGWDWIYYMTSYGMPGTLNKDVYCNKNLDNQDYRVCDQYLVGNASAYLRDALVAADKSYTFVYLSELDVVGHARRWCEEDYLGYLNTTDDQVGELLDVVDELEAWDDTLVVLSTDHGGFQFSHGWDNDNDMLIPMFLRGPGVKQGHEFHNTVRNYDIGATAAYALGIPLNPWWDGKVMLEAFEDAESEQ